MFGRRDSMKTFGPQRRPSFTRQGLLILLPVLVLAVFGLFSLRQDKLLVWREATDQAPCLRQRPIFTRLTTGAAGENTFTVDAAAD
jgi:hypothetical protein